MSILYIIIIGIATFSFSFIYNLICYRLWLYYATVIKGRVFWWVNEHAGKYPPSYVISSIAMGFFNFTAICILIGGSVEVINKLSALLALIPAALVILPWGPILIRSAAND